MIQCDFLIHFQGVINFIKSWTWNGPITTNKRIKVSRTWAKIKNKKESIQVKGSSYVSIQFKWKYFTTFSAHFLCSTVHQESYWPLCEENINNNNNKNTVRVNNIQNNIIPGLKFAVIFVLRGLLPETLIKVEVQFSNVSHFICIDWVQCSCL